MKLIIYLAITYGCGWVLWQVAGVMWKAVRVTETVFIALYQ